MSFPLTFEGPKSRLEVSHGVGEGSRTTHLGLRWNVCEPIHKVFGIFIDVLYKMCTLASAAACVKLCAACCVGNCRGFVDA